MTLRTIASVAAAAMLSLPAAAGTHKLPNTPMLVDSVPTGDCQHYNVTFDDDRQTFYSQETKTIAHGSFSQLDLHASRNGGIRVEGWSNGDVQVTFCKAADEQAKLDQIRTNVSGGEVSAEGPDGTGRWNVGIVVKVPNGVNLKAEAYNGPMSFSDITGTIDAKTRNGPLSVKRCTGNITAEAQNGPVSVSESAGKVRVTAQNGPMSIQLANAEWQGEGLDASTHNGPLTVRVPQNYRSGVEVVSSGRSPFNCKGCDDGNRSWDNDGTKRVRFGAPGAPVVIHASTVNGPVSVRDTFE